MRAIVLSLFASPLVCLAAACVVVPATQPPEPVSTPTSTPTATAAPTADPAPTATADPAPTSTATADPAPASTGTTAAPGGKCGSRGLGPCVAGEFCDFPAGSECGATDQGGTCKPMPQVCTREYKPVCGCDGQTYPNACAANAKGASVSKEGKCN